MSVPRTPDQTHEEVQQILDEHGIRLLEQHLSDPPPSIYDLVQDALDHDHYDQALRILTTWLLTDAL